MDPALNFVRFSMPSLRGSSEVNTKVLTAGRGFVGVLPLTWCLVFFCVAWGRGEEAFTGLEVTNELRRGTSNTSAAQMSSSGASRAVPLAPTAHQQAVGLQQLTITSAQPPQVPGMCAGTGCSWADT